MSDYKLLRRSMYHDMEDALLILNNNNNIFNNFESMHDNVMNQLMIHSNNDNLKTDAHFDRNTARNLKYGNDHDHYNDDDIYHIENDNSARMRNGQNGGRLRRNRNVDTNENRIDFHNSMKGGTLRDNYSSISQVCCTMRN